MTRTARYDLLLAGSLTDDGGAVVSTCADLVVPGHGAPFEPDVRTPR